MADQYTETTHQSWGSRVSGAISGIVIGVILFLGAFVVLYWNEGRAVDRAETLEAGAGLVVSIGTEAVDVSNEGKLVHFSGETATQDVLRDPIFNISENAIHLARKAEMYQWVESTESETKKNMGGSTDTTTTYTYSKDWRSSRVSSSDFKKPEGHENPAVMLYQSSSYSANNVNIGAFSLPSNMINGISNSTPISLSSLEKFPAEIQGKAILVGGGLYFGDAPGAPRVGDIRVSFELTKPVQKVSVVAKQTKQTLEPYHMKDGSISLLEMGTHSASAMFAEAQSQNTILTWVLRFVGLLMMFIGLNLVLKPLSVLADVVPFIGDLVGMGTGLIAFFVALTLSFVTIAISWFVHRPVLAICLCVAAAALVYWIVKKVKTAKAARVVAAADAI